VHAATVFSLLAAAGLGYALAVGDLQYRYVATWASAATPMPYRIGALWAGPSGTLLLWAAALGAGTSIAAWSLPRRSPLRAWCTGILALLLASVLAMAAFDTNPFVKLAIIPEDGRGISLDLMRPIALLQVPLGYIAMALLSVPAVISVMGVLGGGDAWRAPARRWTLFCWALLSAALLLDWRRRYAIGDWAADWRWAPVHAGTALAWSGAALLAYALARRWNVTGTVTAAFAAFALGLTGLTLRRAGGWSGVHAFAESPMGGAVGWVVGIAVLVALAESWRRVPRVARVNHAAHAAVVTALVSVALSGFTRTHDVAVSEGSSATVTDRFGTPWSITLQGVSTVDRGAVGIGIVALRAAVNGRSRAFIAPEVRSLFPPGSQGATEDQLVSGIAPGIAQDLRVDMREANRADALLIVRFVPAMTFVWLAGIAAVLAMFVLAFSRPAGEEATA
jgi:cytochrome c biogenesis factor